MECDSHPHNYILFPFAQLEKGIFSLMSKSYLEGSVKMYYQVWFTGNVSSGPRPRVLQFREQADYVSVHAATRTVNGSVNAI